MQTPLRVTFDGAPRSDAAEERVREEAESLAQRYPRITACAVTLHAPAQHKHKGGCWTVGLTVSVPGREIHAGHDPGLDHSHEDVYVAIRDAFAAARRQLQDHTARSREITAR